MKYIHAMMISCGIISLILTGCGGGKEKNQHVRTAKVTAITVVPKNTPQTFEFVGETQSSHRVEIRARVEGFLDKQVYTEGAFVKPGQVLFVIDKRPFQALVQQAQGQLAVQQARLSVAQANLSRIKPLAEQNAVSKKDLDDATGNVQEAEASVLAAQANVAQALLNLSYCTITSPIQGASSFAQRQEGSYISPGQDSLLTYVEKLDPIWVNFSVSENSYLSMYKDRKNGVLILPEDQKYSVQIVLADGSIYPEMGDVSFAEPSFSSNTGTFMVRSVFKNPKQLLRPGQYVTVRLLGAIRPNAIVIPRRAVLEGAKGFFVWTITQENTAEVRNVSLGDWDGELVFITDGLQPGDRVIVDGVLTLANGLPVEVTGEPTQGVTASSLDVSAAALEKQANQVKPVKKDEKSKPAKESVLPE